GQLVDDLLSLSRVGRKELSLELTPLDSLVEAALDELEPELAGREIEWRLSPLPSVHCDAMLLKQVFVNLLSNALKYTRTRKRAVIEVGQATRDRQRVVFVRDNGIGFDMAYSRKLFGIFQRLHSSKDFEGTGVGLAIVQRILQKHDWRAWTEAAVDQGATFFFTVGAPQSPGAGSPDSSSKNGAAPPFASGLSNESLGAATTDPAGSHQAAKNQPTEVHDGCARS
ncbi:MAG TPA: ATP-binding protein, partial [Terriglobia bacterium]|nr:ATP-binding protein [Terriglobia bacterium]